MQKVDLLIHKSIHRYIVTLDNSIYYIYISYIYIIVIIIPGILVVNTTTLSLISSGHSAYSEKCINTKSIFILTL